MKRDAVACDLLGEIGGEELRGSGFEDQQPDSRFEQAHQEEAIPE